MAFSPVTVLTANGAIEKLPSHVARHVLAGKRSPVEENDHEIGPSRRPLSPKEVELLHVLYLHDRPLVTIMSKELKARNLYPFSTKWCEKDVLKVRKIIDRRYSDLDRKKVWHFLKARFIFLYPWCTIRYALPILDHDVTAPWFFDLWLVLSFNPYQSVAPFPTLMPYLISTDEASMAEITMYSQFLAKPQARHNHYFATRGRMVRRVVRATLKALAWCTTAYLEDKVCDYKPGGRQYNRGRKSFKKAAKERPKPRRRGVKKMYAAVNTTKYQHDALLRLLIAEGEAQEEEERRRALWEDVVPYKARASLFSRTLKQSEMTEYFEVLPRSKRQKKRKRYKVVERGVTWSECFLVNRDGNMAVELYKNDTRPWYLGKRLKPCRLDDDVVDVHIDDLEVFEDMENVHVSYDDDIFDFIPYFMHRCIKSQNM